MNELYMTILSIYFIQTNGFTQIDSTSNTGWLAKERNPLIVSAAYTVDAVQSVSSYKIQHLGFVGNLDLKVDLDTKKANWWQGGTLHLYAINNHGASPTANHIGDLQNVSNIEAPKRTYLFELWYEQKLGRFSFLIGQHDVNSEFATSRYGVSFLNGSFGFQPDIALNIPISNFSFTTVGIRSKVELKKNLLFRWAIYKGNPGNKETNPYGINWRVEAKEGFLTIQELGYYWPRSEYTRGSIKLGTWYHSKMFQSLIDSSRGMKGNKGLYCIIDHSLFVKKSNPSSNLGAFIQLGIAPKEINAVNFYSGAGLVYSGLLPARSNDVVGLAVANAEYNNALVNISEGVLAQNENVIELTYQALINKYLMVQSKLQYLINPGSRNTNNRLITILRVSIRY